MLMMVVTVAVVTLMKVLDEDKFTRQLLKMVIVGSSTVSLDLEIPKLGSDVYLGLRSFMYLKNNVRHLHHFQ